jgi:hypothetical protein
MVVASIAGDQYSNHQFPIHSHPIEGSPRKRRPPPTYWPQGPWPTIVANPKHWSQATYLGMTNLHRMGPPVDSVQLPYKWLKKLWFVVDITKKLIGVIMVYKPTYNCGAPSCMDVTKMGPWSVGIVKGPKVLPTNEKITRKPVQHLQYVFIWDSIGASIF